jgi:cystathionine beta-synthase
MYLLMMNDRIIAKRLHEETKGSVYINQYFNQLNIDAHYKSTGPEIWKQTNGNITFSCL